MKFKAVYLTGAPAAGKFTLARALARDHDKVEVFEYGAQMSARLSSKIADRKISQELLRGGTEPHVSSFDIEAVNRVMGSWIKDRKPHSNLIVDTHQVTVEDYGLKYVPFPSVEFVKLGLDEIWLVQVEPEVAINRITADAKGRPLTDEQTASIHANMQLSVATTYAALAGIPLYVLNGDTGKKKLVEFAERRFR